MLHLRRRHLKSCSHRASAYLKCKCPLWVVGKVDDKFIRRSLDTQNLEKAEMMRREIEAGTRHMDGVSVSVAVERFLADAEARHLKEPTLRKYRQVMNELRDSLAGRVLRSLSVQDLRSLRESWVLSASSARKRIELLRGFFSFCVASGWIQVNPAKALKPPPLRQSPTLPYSKDEWEKILWALDSYSEIHSQSPVRIAKQLKAVVLLMRYSGLRISDTISLKRDRISDQCLFLYTAKTGNPVLIPLPPLVLNTLKECDEGNPYYFWNGVGKLKTALTEWQERLKKVFVIAGLPQGHSHRFRDSFAVSLLQKGVSLQEVSILLGHSSVRTTELHYSPWVKSRQDALEIAVRGTWT
jgi:integrase/recombinase XerD